MKRTNHRTRRVATVVTDRPEPVDHLDLGLTVKSAHMVDQFLIVHFYEKVGDEHLKISYPITK